MGKICKDFKSLIAGEDGTGTEPEDFKTEVAKALKEGLITKPEGALLIATKMNADKKGSEMIDSQEKDVKKIKQDEVYDTIEEEIATKKEKEEKERRRREKEAQIARQMAEAAKKKNQTGGTSKKIETKEENTLQNQDKIRE